jgi:hypothetical protein
MILELEKEGSNMLLYCLPRISRWPPADFLVGNPSFALKMPRVALYLNLTQSCQVAILAQPLFCPIKMLFNCCFTLLSLHLLFFQIAGVASKPDKPDYVILPTLREQTAIQDAWTAQRLSNIPNILNKYAVDAWLVR